MTIKDNIQKRLKVLQEIKKNSNPLQEYDYKIFRKHSKQYDLMPQLDMSIKDNVQKRLKVLQEIKKTPNPLMKSGIELEIKYYEDLLK